MALLLSIEQLLFLLLSTCLPVLYASESNRQFPPIRAVSPPDTKPSDLPFPYVGSTVTAAKIMMDASQVTSYDGSDKDHIAVDILGQGPVPFSIPRFNRGDLSPRISPRHPYSQTNLGVVAGDEGYSCDDPRQFPAQAWRPSVNRGVLLATVAQNGQQWNDGTPFFYGTVSCVHNSRGFGYSMDNGAFGDSDPNIDVVVGKAGKRGEGNIDVALAWFPYDQGWLAGYVDAPSEYSKQAEARWLTPSSHSSPLSANLRDHLHWGHKGAKLRLPGVDPSSDGMLFLTSTDPGSHNNDVNIMSTYVRKGKKSWRIQAREDSIEDPSQLVDTSEHMFAFLYVPFSAGGLIGGNIGEDGSVQKAAGSFTVGRLAAGLYEIVIGEGPKTERDGVLLLQVTGRDETKTRYAKHAFLSYNYSSTGSLLVESHHVAREPNNYFDEAFPFTDTAFSFVWVDFRNPLTPTVDTYTGTLPSQYSSSRFWFGFGTGCLVSVLIAAAVVVAIAYYSTSRVPQFASLTPLSETVSGDQELREDLLQGVYVTSQDE